ncbi:hypothetical protein [Echinimonas agarilytica]|uniref:hypothetical protein n=1 Tax=Echinimonas agarilytica TaxID=1215918 RepID=UPI0032E4163B
MITRKLISRIKSLLVILSVVSLTACSTVDGMTTEKTNKEKAIAVISSIETGDPQAVNYINPAQYTQHNLGVGDGLEGFGQILKALPAGSAKADVKRAYQDGDYVFLHTEYNFFGPKVGFDVFRFEDGKIVEHWDNLAELASQPNPSGRTQLDGTIEVTDQGKTEENKAVVADFVNVILIQGDMSKINQFIDNEDRAYLQHNTMVADGLSGLGKAINDLTKAGMPMIYKENHKLLGEGNFVLAISEGIFMNKDVAFYDLFRLENGKIVEHWDVIENIPPRNEWKNDNGKFGFEHDDVVEVASFILKDGIDPTEFAKLDKTVEDTHVSQQPGFISRASELVDGNRWRVIVHWESLEDAEASMASFMKAPAAKAFMDGADVSTMKMQRYEN